MPDDIKQRENGHGVCVLCRCSYGWYEIEFICIHFIIDRSDNSIYVRVYASVRRLSGLQSKEEEEKNLVTEKLRM